MAPPVGYQQQPPPPMGYQQQQPTSYGQPQYGQQTLGQPQYTSPQPQQPPPPAQGYGAAGGANVPANIAAVSAYVANYRKLGIKQRVSMVEAAVDTMSGTLPGGQCCAALAERPNVYDVYGEDGLKILTAHEESDLLPRACCNPAHPLKLHVHVGSKGQRQQVILIDRPFKGPSCCPAICEAWQQVATQHVMPPPGTPGMIMGQKFAHETMASQVMGDPGAMMGKSMQPCLGGCLTPTVDVHQGHQLSPFAQIRGPTCCFGGMTAQCMDQTFEIEGAGGGQIIKEKPHDFSGHVQELMTDSDIYSIVFADPNTPAEQKMNILLAALHLDYLFFENNQPCSVDLAAQTVSCTLCRLYCCGCSAPFKCTCGGKEGGRSGYDDW